MVVEMELGECSQGKNSAMEFRWIQEVHIENWISWHKSVEMREWC